MTPIQTFSHLRAKKMSPNQAWTLAKDHLHEDKGWGSVMAHALKEDPALSPELFDFLNNATGPEETVLPVYNQLKKWLSSQTMDDARTALAIWASQSEMPHCPLQELVDASPFAWHWSLAVSLLPEDTTSRRDHKLLVLTMWLEHSSRTQSNTHTLEPSMVSDMFES